MKNSKSVWKGIIEISHELSEVEFYLGNKEDTKLGLSRLLKNMQDLVHKLKECLPTCHWCDDLIPYPYDRVKVGHSNSNQIKHRFCSLDCESIWRHNKWRNQDNK